MSLRRSGSALALALALAAACTNVKQEPPAPTVVIATFASPTIPTPNDLAMAAANANAVPPLPASAQKDLLASFIASGGFPSDQAPTLTVPLQALAFDPATNRYAPAAPPAVDVATVTPSTFVLYKLGGAAPLVVETEPLPQALQAPGQLRVVKKADASGSRRLDPGRYVFAARGGASGVKTTTGLPISPDLPVALTLPNRDLTVKENQPRGGLAPAQVAQLEQIRGLLWNPVAWSAVTVGPAQLWVPCVPPGPGVPPPCTPDPTITPAYQAITAFPVAETASIATFEIGASLPGPYPLLDATSGQAPLPIDLARTGPNGTIAFNPAFGPAAAGIATLDGFSTTAMILAQTSVPVDASTVNGANVFLYEWPQGNAGAPALLPELKATLGGGGNPATARYVAEPTPIVIPSGGACPAAGGCSPAIGLQPAASAPVPGVGTFHLPPLAENRRYAVVITNRVKDVLGRKLVKPTVAKLLLDLDPSHLLAQNGKSLVGGIDDATAVALQTMRTDLAPVLAALPSGTTAADVVLAYTFKTQSFLGTSLQLSAAPYAIEKGAASAVFTPAAVADVTPPPGVPTAGVAGFFDVTFKSVDAIDKGTGALRPTLAADLGSAASAAALLGDLHALVAVPDASAVPACPAPFPAGTRCARLVVVGHGLNGSKETLFALASSLAGRGLLAAAIDFPLHGGRNWCTADADCQAGTCDKSGAFAGSAGQGDCGSNDPASAACTAARPGVCSGGAPKPGNSRFFLSANFFRMRDAFRQNLLDQSALALALARPPAPLAPQPAANPFTAKLPAGVFVDPTEVYYEGVSLGSIAGTSVLATNPRLTRGALSVGGGTFIDIGISSPTFQAQLAPLFTALLQGALPAGASFSFDMVDPTKPAFSPAVAAAFLKLVNVAKWIDDPGDPLNYAGHVIQAPLPNLLANPDGSVAQAAKAAYGQIAQGDTVVPNPTSELLYALMGADTTLYTGPGASHGMIGTKALVQQDASGFLVDPSSPPPATQNLP